MCAISWYQLIVFYWAGNSLHEIQCVINFECVTVSSASGTRKQNSCECNKKQYLLQSCENVELCITMVNYMRLKIFGPKESVLSKLISHVANENHAKNPRTLTRNCFPTCFSYNQSNFCIKTLLSRPFKMKMAEYQQIFFFNNISETIQCSNTFPRARWLAKGYMKNLTIKWFAYCRKS